MKLAEVRMAYRIADGASHEVNVKGGRWKQGDEMRSGPIPYLSIECIGSEELKTFRAIKMLAKDDVLAFAVGYFWVRLAQLAARQDSKRRWWLLDKHGNPKDTMDIAIDFNVSEDFVIRALEILTNKKVGWVTHEAFPENPEPYITNAIQPSENKIDQGIQEHPEDEDLARIGDLSIAGVELSEALGSKKRSLADEIEDLTGEPAWTPWWKVVCGRLWKKDRRAHQALYDEVQHVKASRNPHKSESPIKDAGRYLSSRAIKICKEYDLKWPSFPETEKVAKSA